MTYFTAEELCMIEMLTYFNEARNAIYGAVSLSVTDNNTFTYQTENKTIGEILSEFDSDKIAILKSNNSIIDTSYFISGKEWGQVIEYILSNAKISSLVYKGSFDSGSITLGLCFTDGEPNSQEAIVAFLGTANRREWLDDVAAAKMADSPCQEEALDYIDNLPYSDITAIGHSKGGNKAMYTAILSDKVTRCVSFDGQGFSKDFIEKYTGVISEKSSIISNFSLSTDFVHILLEQLPGTHQYYCEGYGIDDPQGDEGSIVAQNHSPNSFFKTDSSGIVTEVNYSGRNVPIFDISTENSKTTLLKKYVTYLLSSKNRSAYDALIDYVEDLLDAILDGSDIQEAILGDLLQLGTLIGYTISFIENEELNLDDARELLYALGLDKCDTTAIIIESLTNKEFSYDDNPNNVPGIISGILGFLGNQLTDGEDDYLLKSIIWDTLGNHIDDYLDEYDFYYLWNTIESKYEEAQENENLYYDTDNGLIQDCVNYMKSNEFRNLVKNDAQIDDIVENLEAYLSGGLSNFVLYTVMIQAKSLLEKYDYRLNLGDDNENYRVGINHNSVSFLGQGDDIFFGGRYKDIIIAGSGDDSIAGGQGNDIIHGGSGNDSLYGGDGNDVIYGGNGNDTVFGGGGKDTIYGGAGNDLIHGGAGDDTIDGGADKDFILGEAGNDIIDGGAGNDHIDGGAGNDTLYGNTGEDVLFGREGKDTLDGGYGDDKLRGGDHADTYYFRKYNGSDTIFDQYGANLIIFEDIAPDDLSISYTGAYQQDLCFTVTSTGKTLTIYDYMHTAEYFRYQFEGESGYYTVKDSDGNLSFSKIEGSHTGGRYDSHWDKLHDDTGNDNSSRYSAATVAQPPRDPLVIDLGTPGIALTTIDDGVYFDLDKNGFAEKTAWIGTEDGFLVLDRNGNGKIDDGGELFSDQVEMSDHSLSKSGFAALSELDENGDGVIDSKDSQFANLQVWVDANHDGNSENELHSLEELGITSISLNHIQTDTVDSDTGTIVTASSVVTFTNGTVREISEHWFQINSADTEEITVTDVENDLTSFGNMHSLSYALEHDESGELRNLVDSFKSAESFIEKRVAARKILYCITGSSDIAIKSRGGAIDARSLHVLETIMGVDSFVGANGSTTPNSNAAVILNRLFADFDRTYFTLLNKVLGEADYLEMIEEEPNENGKIVLNLAPVEEVVDHYISFGTDVREMLYNIGVYVKTYDSTYGTNYMRDFVSHYPDYAAEIQAMVNGNFVIGTNGDDALNGSGAQDIIWAEDGDDSISTGTGNDIIYGGAGNDTIRAGSGNDVVYGDAGDDAIIGGEGNDLLYGGDGNDTIEGNTGNDTIYGGSGNDTITGNEGDDMLYGGDGNDMLDGGEGNDILDGGEGDDSLSGGTGDDTLSGGAGDDTYYINADHGNDTIYDSEGRSTLVFGDELSAEDYALRIDIHSGISLVHHETGETISIPDFINMPEYYDFIFDGEAQIIGGGTSRQVIEGTDEDDVIAGGSGFNIIKGNDGNDIITGGDNLNFIYGGDGDDTITGGNGINIIRGEGGDDTITDGTGDGYLDGGDGNDTIHAGAGNDVLIGGAGNDQLFGEDGDDVIAGNDGDDYLSGGDGNDTLYADAGNDELHGGNGNDSLFGGDGDDTLYGDAGDDYLEAGNGTDTLYGGTGNDIFVGGEGINYMYGEDGDDTFYGGNGLNYMYGGDGDDNFTGGELADYIEGGAGNDTMNGGNGSNEMYGGDGDDYIYGGNDDDYIEGGNGDDHLYGGNGVNTIYGGAGNDIIYSGDNGSFLYGGDGDDRIYAGGGADVLDGGAGNDYLQGDHGGDTYIFGIGYDIDTINASADLNTIRIHGYTVADMHNTRMANNDLVIDFGEGTGDRLVIQGFFNFNSNRDFNFVFDDETVLGQYDIQAASAPIIGTDADEWLAIQGNDGGVIHAGAGNDGLNGGSGNDELYGEAGDDTLYGNDGNDILDGGAGNDQLNGGNGEDTYIFAKGYAQDTINEWGSDHSIVMLTDINSNEITVSDQWGSNLLISVNGTDDVLTISNFKWGQATFTFKFADGAEGYVDKDTWQLVLTKQPDEIEDTEQVGAELLESLYADDTCLSDLLTDGSTVITDMTESTALTDENDDISDVTDVQAMLLAENMSAFGNNDDQISDSVNITDITADTSLTDSLLVGALQ